TDLIPRALRRHGSLVLEYDELGWRREPPARQRRWVDTSTSWVRWTGRVPASCAAALIVSLMCFRVGPRALNATATAGGALAILPFVPGDRRPRDRKTPRQMAPEGPLAPRVQLGRPLRGCDLPALSRLGLTYRRGR